MIALYLASAAFPENVLTYYGHRAIAQVATLEPFEVTEFQGHALFFLDRVRKGVRGAVAHEIVHKEPRRIPVFAFDSDMLFFTDATLKHPRRLVRQMLSVNLPEPHFVYHYVWSDMCHHCRMEEARRGWVRPHYLGF